MATIDKEPQAITELTNAFVDAFRAGNYANAYISERFNYVIDLESEKPLSVNGGYILGFFASYRLREIPARYRRGYIIARRACRKLIIASGVCV